MYKKGFIYSSGLVNRYFGSEEVGTLNSGVVIVSRHPIEHWDFVRFADAVGDDALADKGVVYAKINKKGHHVHVFSSHTQAWQEEAHIACRAKQLAQMRDFITAQCIPKTEAVIICGDLNVNRFAADPPTAHQTLQRGPDSCTNPDSREYAQMLKTLHAEDPRQRVHALAASKGTCLYSADPSSNEFAKPGPSSQGEYELLDYVLVSTEHRPVSPDQSDAWVALLKSKISYMNAGEEQFDLSDHFPVWSRLVFEGRDLVDTETGKPAGEEMAAEAMDGNSDKGLSRRQSLALAATRSERGFPELAVMV